MPIATLLANALGQAATSRERLTALSIAESCIETLNNEGPPMSQGVPETNVYILANNTGLKVPATLPQSCMGAATSVTKSTIAYTVHAEFTWTTAEGNHPDLCTSGTVPSVLDLQVTVTWLHVNKITDTTIINYPPGGILTIGFLAIQVNGDQVTDADGHSWASRVQAVPTTVTNASTTASFSLTAYPNSYGCVFVAVPVGEFKVSLGQPAPGTPAGTSFGAPTTPTWVENLDEKTTTVKTATPQVVYGGQVTDVTFQYDEGTLVNLAYPSSSATDGGVVCPGEGSIQCLAFGQSPTSTLKPATTPVADLLVKTSSGWSVETPGGVQLVAAGCAASTRCIAVGTAKTKAASVSSGTSTPPNFTADTVPSGVTSLSAVTCPTSSTCFAVGHAGSTPTILTGTVSAGSVTWTKGTLTKTKVTRLANLACPAKTKCYAVGAKGTTPVILSLSGTSTWKTVDTLPTGTTKPSSIAQVACPSKTVCFAIGIKKKAAVVGIMSLTTATKWKYDTLTTLGATYKATAATQIVCPSTTTCYVLGSRKKGTTTTGAIFYWTKTITWKLATTPSLSSISKITCLNGTTCVALGSGPTLLWRNSKKTFGSATLTSGYTVSSLSSVACASATHCFVTGVGTKSGVTGAIILSGHGTSTWAADSVPASLMPVFYSGIACTGSVCAAPGGTETAAIVLSATASGTTWTNGAPTGLHGMYISDAPITVTDASLQPSTPLELVAPTADKVQIGPLYPFSGGYSVSAADNKCEYKYGAAVSTVPGATTTATLPLGILPVKGTNSSGTPASGATVTATVTDATSCGTLTPLSGTNPTSYSLAKTDALGMSGIAVIYDTYSVKVTLSGTSVTKTVVVTPTALVVTGTSQPLATPVVFSGL